jgi:DNA-binding transcriptional regulator GbsR (MarR family)
MKSFKDFNSILSEEEQIQMKEVLGQFKDATKEAEDMAKQLRKTIHIMQHVRKLERKNYEVVDEVKP